MYDMNKNNKIPDDFWDIESLIPQKKDKKPLDPRQTGFDVSSVDVEVRDVYKTEKIISGSSFTRFIPPHNAREVEEMPKPELEYYPEHSLIHHVKIFSLENKYNFYERFLDDAIKYQDVKGEEAVTVPFFSYTPQYSQLNRAQLAYYLWWRENIRKGTYLEADYSYVLLYLYELINLSPLRDKYYTLDEMCAIWLHYGGEHKFISKYLGEWICDFCLINKLSVPSEKLRPLYPEIMKNCLIKEFYVTGSDKENGVGNICADTLIEIASAYDYRKSKCATQERLPYMKKHLIGALDAVLSDCFEGSGVLVGMRNSVADNSAVRTAFSGALCSRSVRRRIEIEYYSFSRSYELRYLIADIMKYSENKLRKIWGIKSRLNIYALPTPIKKCIDLYFEGIMPTSVGGDRTREKHEEGTRIYEKLYDVPRAPISIENAEKIEENSWETTRILVEAFEGSEPDKSSQNVSCDTNNVPNPGNEDGLGLSSVLGERACFLLAVFDGDIEAQRKSVSALSAPPEAIVDEINEIAVDLIGDILIIEDGDGRYRIVEEYMDTVRSLKK